VPISTISLGPILIPVSVLGLVTSYIAMTWFLGRIAPRLGLDSLWTRRVIEKSFLVGIIAARLGFTASNWNSYLNEPWTVLFIWQPGYSVGVGITAAIVFSVLCLQRLNGLWHRSSISILTSGILTGVIVFSTVVGLVWALSDQNTVRPGSTISDFTLQDLNGKAVRWSDHEGSGTILNFWATWCPPCLREMPLLDLAHQTYQTQGINVIGISVGESEETVRNYIDSTGITYPIWINGNENTGDQTQEIFDLYAGVGLPTTIFADSQGVIRKLYVGELSQGFIDSEVAKLISKTTQ
jgi:cytochrome c biogenesis protein CcmG/thiol:disulfide interchange protein DsbE